jgi:hypothetical protein
MSSGRRTGVDAVGPTNGGVRQVWSPPGRLDRDHVGAERGEELARQRPRHDPRDVEHLDAPAPGSAREPS